MEQYLFIGPKTLHDFPLLNLNFCTLPDHSANTEQQIIFLVLGLQASMMFTGY
jgi:hypothetical protein